MFLNKLLENNRPLVEFAQKAHFDGILLPDTYILDLDTIEQNARLLLDFGIQNNIRLYFMLKQIGRIPAVGRLLSKLGFAGAVCVDFREALTMIEHKIPIGNVGHLVQTPKAALESIILSHPEIMTVYTLEKAREISDICRRHGIYQDIMLRVIDDGDVFYPGQSGGFFIKELPLVLPQLRELKGVRPAGVTSFPCIEYDEKAGIFKATHNALTVKKAAKLLEDSGLRDIQVNLPSASCAASLELIASYGATHAEPGHSLTGTTPYHAAKGNGPEQPALLYLSEVSHNFGGKSYCYGGGRYGRGHLENALAGIKQNKIIKAYAPPAENIDYHIELDGSFEVSSPVIMCFRTQIFITRSEVAVVKGLSKGLPVIEGIYNSHGQLLRRE